MEQGQGIWIPTVGKKIRLVHPWTFDVYREGRNSDLYGLLATDMENNHTTPWHSVIEPFTMPTGTVLRIDRIYIRGSARKFDSVTFRTVISPDNRLTNTKFKGEGSRRFWAKVDDVNKIVAVDASEVP